MANYTSYVEVTRAAFPDQTPYQWTVNESAPWTPIIKPLAESKVVLIASGGIYMKDQSPFNSIKNDLTFREIPGDVEAKNLRISHDFYDHADAERDINCIFPIERLRELQQEDFIGQLSEVHFTFMGRIFKKTSLLNDMIPHLIVRLKELFIDLAFLVPAWPLCHQSVGLVARAIEEAGIPTVALSSAFDLTTLVKPPRTFFVNYPLGHQAGKPFDRENQIEILRTALGTAKDIGKPGTIVELPYTW